MKKILSIMLAFVITLSFVGCGNKKEAKSDTTVKSQIKTETKKEDNNKKETKITSGELYDKINSVVKVKEITTIEDTEIGFINLNVNVNVPKGTAIEELDSFIKKTGKIQTNLKEYLLKNKFSNITYVMCVEDEMKSVLVIYKKQDNEYILKDTKVLDEKYKKAADAM